MDFPKTYNPKRTEQKIYSLWQKSGFFNPDNLPAAKNKGAKNFVVLMAPPNITGELHIGHALENTLIDILVRRERMSGKKVLWLPGTDHAGIATQNVVERALKKEGKDRFSLGREKFIARIWQWQKKYGDIILKQLKKLGVSSDWSRSRFTMDKNYSKAVQAAFLHYYKMGWIYQGERVVNWCPRCQTSLSDLELENKEKTGKLYYIRYSLKMNSKSKVQKFITVATTRPETMLGDTAIAVNPKDKRYKKLIGKRAILPLIGRELPIIADEHIDPDFGTGALKVTPAHDITDWEIGLKNKLAVIQVIDKKGKMTEASQVCEGLLPLECREKVLELLKKQGFLEKVEDYQHLLPYCYRCHSLIEPIVSKQWFLKMEKLAKKAIRAVKRGEIEFVPKNFEKIFLNWLENIHDWCISRQIWWGHQLPVWFCQTGRNPKSKIRNPKVKERYFVSLKKPKKCPICGNCQPKQIDDVLDTWFSSALWPFAVLGWPSACAQTQNLKQKTQNRCIPIRKSDLFNFYPADLISSDRGIINLWIARMVFSGLEFMGEVPFKTVYIHPTVLTKEGKRMSKSLGTGIDPLALIEQYGADATRFALAWQTTGLQDIRFDENVVLMGKKFCNKVWNAARFVLGQTTNLKIKGKNLKLYPKTKSLTPADRTILSQLQKTVKIVNRDLDNFRFGQAAGTIYHFFWHKFCDKYLEEAKSQLQTPNYKLQTAKILLYVLITSLKLLHPFLPFLTEQIYQKLPVENKKPCLMIEQWPE